MTRSSFRPIASVGLVVALLGYVGCQTNDHSSKKDDAATTDQPKPVETKAGTGPKLIADLSARPPAAIILISGEQDGYPDPCGCTAGQLGGLGRRYDFLDKLQAKGWPIVKIDLGNLVRPRGDSRGGPKQEMIKFEVILQALKAMKYDAVALGPEDLKLGVQEMLTVLLNVKEPQYLAANARPISGMEATVRPMVITKAGPVTIGITSVIDPAKYAELQQDPSADLLVVKPPDEVLPGLLAEMEKQVQVKVLMVQGPHDEARRLAEKFPGFDIVIGTSENADPDQRPQTVNGGKTLLLDNIGKQGKYAGVVSIYPGASPMLQFVRQPLDSKDFIQAEPMRKLIDFDYQEMLKREGVVENFPRIPNGKAPAGATYLGAESCQACHPKTFEKWATTKHAKAFDALTNPKRNRVFDAECISCHTTGFGYNTGWISAEKTPSLKGNQCENCHGPGSLHVLDTDNSDYRERMRMTAEAADKNNFCTKCHDDENDHDFKFDTRYSQIFHKGFDSYDDPKVHKGPAFQAKNKK